MSVRLYRTDICIPSQIHTCIFITIRPGSDLEECENYNLPLTPLVKNKIQKKDHFWKQVIGQPCNSPFNAK